jgi:signal transduction histidine kinase
MADPVNILLVDDQPAKLLSYEVILAGLGEHLIKASSAREALALLLKTDVAVVLIDVQMPEFDGFELAAMIREHPRFQKTALIFVSAIHMSDFDRIKGYEVGAVDYVPVPVVPELLRAKVRVFADLHRKTRELERWNAQLERRVAERTADLEASRDSLKTLNEELETRIEERTREREQALAQLFEAQKVDTIGQLTGGVAHDFNNLLMAMMGSLQILNKRLRSDPASTRLLENAMRAAERGAALTQRLLAFARRQELRPEAIVIPDLIVGMQDLLARALGPSVQLQRDFPPDLPPVLVDANQLELAILNLSVNARDAMPSGGRVRFEAEACDSSAETAPANLNSGRYVRLSVIDCGAGMDAETVARATEPFFTTKGVGKGTGLGLSMVHGLAAQSGGALRLASTPGEGTRVDLWLPIAPASSWPKLAVIETVAVETDRVRSALNILVVDDDPLVARGTADLLEDLGHIILIANSGSEALSFLENGPAIDLVLTDHAMPGMTGLELAERLNELQPQLQIILTTGYVDGPRTEGFGATLSRLSKPFTQDALAAAIAKCREADGKVARRA